MKELNNLINNQNFLVEYPEKDEPVTPSKYKQTQAKIFS